jgi:hypothetical protein
MQQPRATTSKETGLDKRFLQRTATRGNRCRRIVALEKVAGTSPVGHTLRFRIDIDVSRTLVPGSSDGRAEPALVGETRSEDRQDQGRGSARCASPSERRRGGMLEDQRAEDRAQPLAHTRGYLVEGEDPALLARARTKTRGSAAFVDRGHRLRSVTSGNPAFPLSYAVFAWSSFFSSCGFSDAGSYYREVGNSEGCLRRTRIATARG